MAIDGKDETAWGIDAGPGRRNQNRKAVFRFEKPIEFADGAELAVMLAQNHGGWNSDDHQNNLLGRFRISVTSAEGEVQADPLPSHVREILAVPREQRSRSADGGVVPLLAHDGAGVESGQRADRATVGPMAGGHHGIGASTTRHAARNPHARAAAIF